MNFIKIEENLPVIGEYDVLVLGAGPAGVSAAVSASKMGAKTAIVERYGYTGGQATGGLVILIVGLTDGKEKIIKGFCEETIQKLYSVGAAKDIEHHVVFDPEAMKAIFDLSILENGIKPCYHTYASGIIKDRGRIDGVIVDGKSGRGIIKAKYFIDATGDGDLAKFCNVPFDVADKFMPVTLGFRAGAVNIPLFKHFLANNYQVYQEIIQSLSITTSIGGWIQTVHDSEIWFNIAHLENVDPTSAEDLTKAEIDLRHKINVLIKNFKTDIPGFENAYLADTAAQMGVRDSRRIKGVYRFSKNDLDKTFDDSIALAPNYTEIGKKSVNVPYRCLITEEIDNLIFAGRCISVEHEYLNTFREIPCCMATGQAAGCAAGMLSANEDAGACNVKDINTELLKDILKSQNAILEDSSSSISLEHSKD